MRFRGKKIIFKYEDSFSMDETLKHIIYQGIIYFKETLVRKDKEGNEYIGIPSSLVEKDSGIDIDMNVWYDILDEMAYAFDKKKKMKY